jgi:hypothetical protein
MKKLAPKKQPKRVLLPDQLTQVSGGFNPQPDPPGDIPRIPRIPVVLAV